VGKDQDALMKELISYFTAMKKIIEVLAKYCIDTGVEKPPNVESPSDSKSSLSSTSSQDK